MKDVRDALMLARSSDGRLVHRPLSPHLQVYRWPVSMALSISHRVTGVGLAIGALLMTWWLVAAAASEQALATVQGFFGSGFGIFLLFCWAAALLFHLCTGIRHLIWDTGRGFDAATLTVPPGNRTYRVSGWAVIAATVVLTLTVWVVGMVMR